MLVPEIDPLVQIRTVVTTLKAQLHMAWPDTDLVVPRFDIAGTFREDHMETGILLKTGIDGALNDPFRDGHGAGGAWKILEGHREFLPLDTQSGGVIKGAGHTIRSDRYHGSRSVRKVKQCVR